MMPMQGPPGGEEGGSKDKKKKSKSKKGDKKGDKKKKGGKDKKDKDGKDKKDKGPHLDKVVLPKKHDCCGQVQLPVYNDPAFRRKMRRMIDEFKEQEDQIHGLEKTKDKLTAQYRLTGVDEEDLNSCNNELEEIIRVI